MGCRERPPVTGSDHEALIDRPAGNRSRTRFGGPFVMIAVLLSAWVSGRVVLWENPFPISEVASQAAHLIARGERVDPSRSGPVAGPVESARANRTRRLHLPLTTAADHGPGPGLEPASGPGLRPGATRIASAHHFLWRAALVNDGRGAVWSAQRERYEAARAWQTRTPVFPGTPPFVANQKKTRAAAPDRWSLGAWSFIREGSRGTVVAPGPAPVYGASQAGANLQYRLMPEHAADPRAYLRGSQALIASGETEAALGLSARPARRLPVRLAAEARLSQNAFGRDVRPAAFAITELPPVSLPLGASAEIYAAGGYVGGRADTGFAEGQATLTRELASFDLRRADDVRVSVGAGAWGGAQRGAQRVDVGPTMRVDMALGPVPARLSIDYRERVGGDAFPNSGVAATLSTQF